MQRNTNNVTCTVLCYWFKRRHKKWLNKTQIAKMRIILNIR